jgi:hypothetical protein
VRPLWRGPEWRVRAPRPSPWTRSWQHTKGQGPIDPAGLVGPIKIPASNSPRNNMLLSSRTISLCVQSLFSHNIEHMLQLLWSTQRFDLVLYQHVDMNLIDAEPHMPCRFRCQRVQNMLKDSPQHIHQRPGMQQGDANYAWDEVRRVLYTEQGLYHP